MLQRKHPDWNEHERSEWHRSALNFTTAAGKEILAQVSLSLLFIFDNTRAKYPDDTYELV